MILRNTKTTKDFENLNFKFSWGSTFPQQQQTSLVRFYVQDFERNQICQIFV